MSVALPTDVYQGMTFLIPFFFLLDDSVLGSGFSDFCDALSELVALACVSGAVAPGVVPGVVLAGVAAGAAGAGAAAGAFAGFGAPPVSTEPPLITLAASASDAVVVSSLLSTTGRAGLFEAGSAAAPPAGAAAGSAPAAPPAPSVPASAGAASGLIGAGKLLESPDDGAAPADELSAGVAGTAVVPGCIVAGRAESEPEPEPESEVGWTCSTATEFPVPPPAPVEKVGPPAPGLNTSVAD